MRGRISKLRRQKSVLTGGGGFRGGLSAGIHKEATSGQDLGGFQGAQVEERSLLERKPCRCGKPGGGWDGEEAKPGRTLSPRRGKPCWGHVGRVPPLGVAGTVGATPGSQVATEHPRVEELLTSVDPPLGITCAPIGPQRALGGGHVGGAMWAGPARPE